MFRGILLILLSCGPLIAAENAGHGCLRPAYPSSSVQIPVRMLAVPVPGRFYDLLEPGVFRFPTQFLNRFRRGGDELGGVAGTAGFFEGGDFGAGELLAHLDDLADGIAVAVTQVIEALF